MIPTQDSPYATVYFEDGEYFIRCITEEWDYSEKDEYNATWHYHMMNTFPTWVFEG